MRLFYVFSIVIFLCACYATDKGKTALTVQLYNTTNDMVGTAKLSEHPDGVKMKLKLEGISPGYHGVHIHEHATCEAPQFKSAGNHFNPDDKEHGLLNAKGAHVGDLPNVEADYNGKIDEELMIEDATLLKGNKSLTEREGTAIILTEDADDGMTQISGNSGKRIVCGEIKANSKTDREKSKDSEDEK